MKEAERKAIGVTVHAQAEKAAAEDHAAALRIRAEAEADQVRIAADAEERRYAVDSEGQESLHLAENVLSPELIAMRIKLELIKNLDSIIRESVKPIEAIDGIKIIRVEGLNSVAGGGSSNGSGDTVGDGAASGNLSDQVVNAALRYRGQAPVGGEFVRVPESLRILKTDKREKIDQAD